MKILIIDNSSISKKGDTFFTNSLNGLFVKDLINCGNSLSYFQFASETSETINSFDLQGNGVKCLPQKLYKNKVFRYVLAYFKLIPIILKNDFVYFYHPNSLRYGALLCKLFGKRYGLYVRGMQGVKNRLSKKLYKNAFVVFTVSDYFTDYINNEIKSQKAYTIRPMIPFTDKDVVINRTNLPKEKFSFLFLGRVARDKGINELLEAVNILNKKRSDFELILVGNGEFLEEAKRKIKDLAIEIVSVKGAVLDAGKVKEYYLNADAYILPTYHEGFPRTLYEAMIFGTPIITTFVGGIPALMKDGWNCKEIKPKSVDSIVEGLEFAIKNYDKMAEFAKNGTNTVFKIVDSQRLTHAQHLDKIIKNN